MDGSLTPVHRDQCTRGEGVGCVLARVYVSPNLQDEYLEYRSSKSQDTGVSRRGGVGPGDDVHSKDLFFHCLDLLLSDWLPLDFSFDFVLLCVDHVSSSSVAATPEPALRPLVSPQVERFWRSSSVGVRKRRDSQTLRSRRTVYRDGCTPRVLSWNPCPSVQPRTGTEIRVT